MDLESARAAADLPQAVATQRHAPAIRRWRQRRFQQTQRKRAQPPPDPALPGVHRRMKYRFLDHRLWCAIDVNLAPLLKCGGRLWIDDSPGDRQKGPSVFDMALEPFETAAEEPADEKGQVAPQPRMTMATAGVSGRADQRWSGRGAAPRVLLESVDQSRENR